MSSSDKWVRRFLVSDPTLHEKQFTVYKVTSIVFPKGLPEAATKVITWKRYSDFKKLNKEMKLYCKSLKTEEPPSLGKATFFKRFDPQVIESRRKSALTMLEFIANNPVLFTSDLFTKFLQDQNCIAKSNKSDPIYNKFTGPDVYHHDSLSHCSTDSRSSSALDTDSAICSSVLSVDVPFVESPANSSSLIFKHECPKLDSSKLSADSLLSGRSVESTEPYFERSSNKYKSVSPAFGKSERHENVVFQNEPNVTCRISFCKQDLKRYKVMGILKHLMYVQDLVSKEFYVMKGVEKCIDVKNHNHINILPHNTRNVVKLHAAVETDSSVYLVLEYIKHVKLWDHLTNYFKQCSHRKKLSTIKTNVPSTKAKVNSHSASSTSLNRSKDSNQHECNDLDIPSQSDSYVELIRSYRARSDKLSASLLNVQSEIKESLLPTETTSQTNIKNQVYQAPFYFETGYLEEDNFNKLMQNIDIAMMKNSEKGTFSKSSPNITSHYLSNPDVTLNSAEKSRLTANSTFELPNKLEDLSLSISDFSNSQNSKYNDSLLSINSFYDSLDYSNLKFIDEPDPTAEASPSSISNGMKEFLKEEPSSPSSVNHNQRSSRKDSVENITSSSDISIIKDSCYKVLHKIDTILHNTSDLEDKFDLNEVCNDFIVDSTNDQITLSDDNTVDLIEKAQKLLNSVNQTLQECEISSSHQKSTLKQNIDNSKANHTKQIKERSRFQSKLESSSFILNSNSVREDKETNQPSIRSKVESSHSRNDILERNISCNDECSETDNKTCRNLILTFEDRKIRSTSLDHSNLSPQIVMNEESTFNFKFLFADPATINEEKLKLWAGQILLGLESLHRIGIICWDLNPENILLNQDGNIKLTYFYRHKQVRPVWNSAVLNGYYVAPELLACPPSSPDETQDWWSFGVLLFHLFTGNSLRSCHPEGIYPHTVLNIPDNVSSEASSLLTELLKFNPQDRLGSGTAGAEEIKSHIFFNNMNWSACS